MLNATSFKIIVAILIAVGSLTFGFLPFIIIRLCGYCDAVRNSLWFYVFFLFSCALIGSTGINHVLMTAMAAMDVYSPGLAYPWAPALCTFAMFATYCIDMIANPVKALQPVAYGIQIMDEDAELPPSDGILLAIALFVHSGLEGLVFGSSTFGNAKASKIYPMLAAMILHKLLEALALGFTFEGYGYTTTTKTITLASFALLTPIGIAVGAMASFATNERVVPLVEGLLSAIASGIFVYAGLSLILTKITPYAARNTRWRYVSITSGWLVSVVVAYFA
jgi:zinc transporter ZupT